MAFDKAKVLKAAEKFLSQGKINAAIKEYRQIVDNDADDFTTLNMLGDLYVRSNKKEEAVACFERIEERCGIDEFAPAGVDQIDAVFHLLDGIAAEEVKRLRGEREVQGNDVAILQ